MHYSMFRHWGWCVHSPLSVVALGLIAISGRLGSPQLLRLRRARLHGAWQICCPMHVCRKLQRRACCGYATWPIKCG
eukprot:2225022-Amphidinium_carterae.1